MSTKSRRRKTNRAWMQELIERTRQPVDRMLLMFSKMADMGACSDVTIDVGGTVYSGVLMSPTQYNRAVIENLTKGLEKAFPTVDFANIAAIADVDPQGLVDGFIHLEKVRILRSAGPSELNGALLRVRLSEVRAWCPGGTS